VIISFSTVFIIGQSLSKAVSIFENDERFKALERERDRRDLFDSFMEELVNKVDSTTTTSQLLCVVSLFFPSFDESNHTSIMFSIPFTFSYIMYCGHYS